MKDLEARLHCGNRYFDCLRNEIVANITQQEGWLAENAVSDEDKLAAEQAREAVNRPDDPMQGLEGLVRVFYILMFLAYQTLFLSSFAIDSLYRCYFRSIMRLTSNFRTSLVRSLSKAYTRINVVAWCISGV